MSKSGKIAAILTLAAGAILFGIPLLNGCLGWFGCAFRPWVMSAAIVVPTVLFLAAIVVASCNAISKPDGSSLAEKTIETFIFLIMIGFLCLVIGGIGIFVFAFSYTPESVVERYGQKMVMVEGDANIYYHAYKNVFIMSKNVLLQEGFSSKALDSISSKNDPRLTETTEFAR